MTNTKAYELLDEMWELLFQEMRNSTFKDLQESGKLNEYMKAHNMALLALKKEKEEQEMFDCIRSCYTTIGEIHDLSKQLDEIERQLKGESE